MIQLMKMKFCNGTRSFTFIPFLSPTSTTFPFYITLESFDRMINGPQEYSLTRIQNSCTDHGLLSSDLYPYTKYKDCPHERMRERERAWMLSFLCTDFLLKVLGLIEGRDLNHGIEEPHKNIILSF